MQAAKDSFYMALRNRLATVNPQRTVTIDGVSRPGIVVAENERAVAEAAPCNVFQLHWGAVKMLQPGTSTLSAMECTIAYSTAGTSDNSGVDRGRMLAAIDCDLLSIATPPQAPKCDYSSGTGVELGSTIFWTQPVLTTATASDPSRLSRQAAITVYFYPEVNQS